MIKAVASGWLPPKKYSLIDWMEKYFRIPAQDSDTAGLYNADYVPYFWGIMHALDSKNTKMIVLMKAAQIGWTLLETGWLAKIICTSPSRILGLFPKADKAIDFIEEKFTPVVESTPELAKKIDVTSSRKSGNRSNKKNFPGGFLKVFGSNSVSNVKSTPAPMVLVEEPDDTNSNVGDQGDAIRLARERIKRFPNHKFVLGGTPSLEGLSEVEHYTNLSSQRVLPIECHECGDSHVLAWENVSWIDAEEGDSHPIFKRNQPDTAVYVCPHCGVAWNDWQRKRNVFNTCKKARDAGDPFCGWVATVNCDESVEGFKDLNELYVCMPGTGLAAIVRDYLEAEYAAEKGEESARIVFRNSKLGKTYSYKGKDDLTHEQLEELAEDYPELVCPANGLIVTAGVDVQDDRLAIIVRAFGRNEESWLMYWGEMSGNTSDPKDPVWDGLEKMLFSGFKHERFGTIYLSAVSMDSSDGGTNHSVYGFVRNRRKRFRSVLMMAIKGSSHDNGKANIFASPKTVDRKNPERVIKADSFGVKVYIVGTHKAKDIISKRLVGTSAFMHSYKSARPDYWEQASSEVKAPSKSLRGVKVWTKRSGRRNEALDCEVYALHASMARNVHTKTPRQWDGIEQLLAQNDLFSNNDDKENDQDDEEDSPESEQSSQETKTNKRRFNRKRRKAGFVSRVRQ